MNSRGVLLCTAAAVLFGASAPAASRLADDMSAFTLAGLLYLGAAIAVMPIVVRDPPSAPTLRRGGSRLAVAVVVGGAIAPVLLAAGLTRTSAASASLLLNLELGFTVVLAGLLFGEHLGRRVVTGTLAVVAGGVVLAWSASTDLRIGALLIAGACVLGDRQLRHGRARRTRSITHHLRQGAHRRERQPRDRHRRHRRQHRRCGVGRVGARRRRHRLRRLHHALGRGSSRARRRPRSTRVCDRPVHRRRDGMDPL